MTTLQYLLKAIRPLTEDLLSTIVFAVLYGVTGNLTLGIALGIAVGVGQVAWLKLRGRRVEPMQWMSMGLVVVLGSASLLSGNPHFAMFKPSVGAFAVGCIMLKPGWQARYMPQIVRDNLNPRAMAAWGFGWAAMLFAISAANLYVALQMSYAAWVWFTTFVPISAQLGLFFLQFVTIRRAIIRKFRDAAPQEAAPAE